MTLFDIMRLIKGGGGGSISLQTKTASPTKASQSVTADEGYDGLSAVTVNAIPDLYRRMPTLSSPTRTVQWFDGVTIGSTQAIRLLGDPPIVGETITVQPTITNYTQAGEPAKACITGTVTSVEGSGSSVLVTIRVTDKYIDYIPNGTINIDTSGTYNIKDLAEAVVDVPGPESVLTGTDAPTILTIGNLPTVRMYGLYHHDAIQELHLPDTKSLSMYALSFASALKILDIPKTTLLAEYALANCTALQFLNAPNLTTITSYTFNGCSAIETLNLPSLTKIASTLNVFDGCSNLKSLRMPKLERTGETQSNVFRLCSRLVSADVGYMVRLNSSSGSSASLTGLNVPATLKLIALRYSGIVALSAAFNANSPLTLGTGFVFVPRNKISGYQTATNWAALYNAGTQFLAIEDYTVDGTASGALDEDKIDALLA